MTLHFSGDHYHGFDSERNESVVVNGPGEVEVSGGKAAQLLHDFADLFSEVNDKASQASAPPKQESATSAQPASQPATETAKQPASQPASQPTSASSDTNKDTSKSK